MSQEMGHDRALPPGRPFEPWEPACALPKAGRTLVLPPLSGLRWEQGEGEEGALIGTSENGSSQRSGPHTLRQT